MHVRVRVCVGQMDASGSIKTSLAGTTSVARESPYYCPCCTKTFQFQKVSLLKRYGMAHSPTSLANIVGSMCLLVSAVENSDSLSAVLYYTRCGHVFCESCATKFIAPSMKCFSCECKVYPDKEIISLQQGGTYLLSLVFPTLPLTLASPVLGIM